MADQKSILDGMFRGSQYRKTKTHTINVRTPDGEDLFSFEVRPLSDTEYQEAREFGTEIDPTSPSGQGRIDTSKVRSMIIYMATTDEYKTLTWDNPEAIKQYAHGIKGASWKVIDEVLPGAGVKDQIYAEIDAVAGYRGRPDIKIRKDREQVEEAKNS